MENITLISLLLTIIGSLLAVVTKLIGRARRENEKAEDDLQLAGPETLSTSSHAYKVLITFAAIVVIFGTITLVQYWDIVRQHQASLYFAFWLFLTMIAGMFVQVIASNYRLGKDLLDVSASQLIFPVLFSIIVFYPIWAVAASATHGFFSIHAAFLNGYFWESVVTSTRPPEAPRQ